MRNKTKTNQFNVSAFRCNRSHYEKLLILKFRFDCLCAHSHVLFVHSHYTAGRLAARQLWWLVSRWHTRRQLELCFYCAPLNCDSTGINVRKIHFCISMYVFTYVRTCANGALHWNCKLGEIFLLPLSLLTLIKYEQNRGTGCETLQRSTSFKLFVWFKESFTNFSVY